MLKLAEQHTTQKKKSGEIEMNHEEKLFGLAFAWTKEEAIRISDTNCLHYPKFVKAHLGFIRLKGNDNMQSVYNHDGLIEFFVNEDGMTTDEAEKRINYIQSLEMGHDKPIIFKQDGEWKDLTEKVWLNWNKELLVNGYKNN